MRREATRARVFVSRLLSVCTCLLVRMCVCVCARACTCVWAVNTGVVNHTSSRVGSIMSTGVGQGE